FSTGGGVASDTVKPTLLLGPTFGLGDVFFATVGAIFQPQTRLLGELEEGQTVPAALTEKQLQTDTYIWNWFFGLSFRFDHEKKSPSETKPAESKKPPAEPKPKEEK